MIDVLELNRMIKWSQNVIVFVKQNQFPLRPSQKAIAWTELNVNGDFTASIVLHFSSSSGENSSIVSLRNGVLVSKYVNNMNKLAKSIDDLNSQRRSQNKFLWREVKQIFGGQMDCSEGWHEWKICFFANFLPENSIKVLLETDNSMVITSNFLQWPTNELRRRWERVSNDQFSSLVRPSIGQHEHRIWIWSNKYLIQILSEELNWKGLKILCFSKKNRKFFRTLHRS